MMRRGRCFLCGRLDGQAMRSDGVRFYYMMYHTATGQCIRKYFCSECENSRTPEIEAKYRESEKNLEAIRG